MDTSIYRDSTSYDTEMKRFAQYIYGARLSMKENGKTVAAKEVARGIDVSYQALVSIEKQKQMPFLETAVKLCKFYGLSMDKFFQLGEYKKYGIIPVKTFEELCRLDPNKRRVKGLIPEETKKFLMSFRDRRRKIGITLDELSPILGISAAVISQIERGVIIPNEKHLRILCNYYHIDEIPDLSRREV